MIDVTLSILALISGGVVLELFTTALPPLGFEGERRSRSQARPSETPEEPAAGNPS